MGQKWLRKLFRRRFFVILLLVIQFAIMIYTLISSSLASAIISRTLMFISFLVCIYIVSRKDKGAYQNRISKIEAKAKPLFELSVTGYTDALKQIPQHAPQFKYLQNFAGFPIYTACKTKYLSPGEQKLEHLLEELKKAEKYIFLEYFIVQKGVMWNAILKVLKEKDCKCGIPIRVFQDIMRLFAPLM